MHIKTGRREIKSINLLPLINVVFLLILFVLIAGRPTTHHPPAIEVAQSQRESAHQAAPFTVVLRRDDRFYLVDGAAVTLAELVDKIAALGIAEQGLAVELLADKRAHAKPLLDFRQAMARAGVGEIRMKTQYHGAAQ